jgi:hypothetical protein
VLLSCPHPKRTTDVARTKKKVELKEGMDMLGILTVVSSSKVRYKKRRSKDEGRDHFINAGFQPFKKL